MTKYGFNFQWMFSWKDGLEPEPPDEKALDFLAETGFNFVRITTDYRFWTRNYEYLRPDTAVFDYLDAYLKACRERNLHLSLNFHRAPGYCLNNNQLERDNLWLDAIAQEGFIYQWKLMAERFRGIDSRFLSFDLVNEPPNIGEYGLTRDNHEDLIRRAVSAIRSVDPNREIAIDGLGGGNFAMPELADLNVIQSGRGYQPMAVSHYDAYWWNEHDGLPIPVYPGTKWLGEVWNRDTLRRFYQPWLDVEKKGARIHIGEFGCYNKTSNDVALRWLGDLLAVFKEFGWGYALWNFVGDFGIIGHDRPNTVYENYKGYKVDRKLLELLLENKR